MQKPLILEEEMYCICMMSSVLLSTASQGVFSGLALAFYTKYLYQRTSYSICTFLNVGVKTSHFDVLVLVFFGWLSSTSILKMFVFATVTFLSSLSGWRVFKSTRWENKFWPITVVLESIVFSTVNVLAYTLIIKLGCVSFLRRILNSLRASVEFSGTSLHWWKSFILVWQEIFLKSSVQPCFVFFLATGVELFLLAHFRNFDYWFEVGLPCQSLHL